MALGLVGLLIMAGSPIHTKPLFQTLLCVPGRTSTECWQDRKGDSVMSLFQSRFMCAWEDFYRAVANRKGDLLKVKGATWDHLVCNNSS